MSDSSPNRPLEGHRLLLGVTGSIAAYKAALLVRLFRKAGAAVQVLMTPDAARFISPLTLGTLSGRPVLTEVFPEETDAEDAGWTKHVELGQWADLFVVAPATAQTLAKLAHGFCDSMLTATALSARCPMLLCPAMDRDMYTHPATRANLERLEDFGAAVMPAAHGELASGLVGTGRLPEPEAILERVVAMCAGEAGEIPSAETIHASPLRGKKVLVTAGPTREPIDPVRHLTNPSTGTMGFALAAAAARRGAEVVLVAGPTTHETPPGVARRIDVETADEMHAACQEHRDADLVLMAAAVSDYAPTERAEEKIKKKDGELTLRLRRTPDILAELGQDKRDGQRLLGFAMETNEGLDSARRKLQKKNLDWIALNNLREEGAGFGTGTNRITLIGRDGQEEALPRLPKRQLAEVLLDRITTAFPSKSVESRPGKS